MTNLEEQKREFKKLLDDSEAMWCTGDKKRFETSVYNLLTQRDAEWVERVKGLKDHQTDYFKVEGTETIGYVSEKWLNQSIDNLINSLEGER